jgi:transcriptional regulator with XRE-family HTH domain
MLRSAFVSLFWAVITHRKKRKDGFTLTQLARALKTNKGEVSRWFRGEPNWTISTIANLASVLDLEISIEARERSTGLVFRPNGVAAATTTQVMVGKQRLVTETAPPIPIVTIKSKDPRASVAA